tara:strand:+ start:3798 stop:5549 length:1752 start_codon:yes stop_codon:yes gene_type:complete
MILFLLKSSACLAIFMLFYKFCLEKTSVHSFKRFYLIGVILISISIPFITFTEYIEIAPVNFISSSELINEPIIYSAEILQPKNYLPTILWSIYVIGVLLFSIRFFKNLYKLVQKIRLNPKYKNQNFINVLLKDLVAPHTFFNYIFLNKTHYENSQIPKEVLLHEQAHAKQIHALDILFIETLQILFWFNPLFYFIKKDIKLNHEFLADQAVINNGANTKYYQELLLAYSSNASSSQLANAINYSLIKKRFTVMKTKTSKTSLWLRNLLLLPLVGALIYGFSTTKQISIDSIPEILDEEVIGSSSYSSTNHTARSISIEVFNNGTYEIDNIKANKKTFLAVINQLHKDITPEIRNRIMNIHLKSSKDISNEEVWFIYNSVIDYGFHRIVTNNQEIIREKGNKPFAITNSYEHENSKINQQIATAKQLAEYNTLAKKYNKQPQNKRVVKLKDVKRLEYLYSLMSKQQKANAEPFPDCPPPPPAPPKIKKGEDSNIPLPPPSPTPIVKKGEVSDIPTPPSPPEPQSPLDHVIEMAKKGATFYYNDKKVSSDKAIDLLKNNEDLNISSKKKDGVYVVKIQTEPIRF